MKLFKGSAVAIITPFSEGRVNLELFKKLILWHIKAGTQAIIVTGTTGESATLTHEEKFALYQCAVETAQGKIPIIANTGTNNTAESIQLSKQAETLGVDGLLLVTPYYNKPNQEGLLAHFKTIADSVTLPIIVYNVPSRTGVNLTPDTLVKLSKISNISGIKEAAGDLEQVKLMIDQTPEDFALYSGNDDLYLETLKLGGDGVISVVANLDPRATQELYLQSLNSLEEAQKIQNQLDILNDVLFIAPNPVPAKTALTYLGVDVGSPRLPLVDMNSSETKILLEALKVYNLNKVSL